MTFDIYASIPKPCALSQEQALERQAQLTKPPGSLGVLEEIAIKFAGWQSTPKPLLKNISLRIYAGDHGVAAPRADGLSVSAFPQQVTAQMIYNFSSGGAAISVLSQQNGFDFEVWNMGTLEPLPTLDFVNPVQVSRGTQDFTQTEAMTNEELTSCLNAGAESVSPQAQLFIGGEMGIGNTTSAAALMAALFGLTGEEVAGRGTGVNDQSLQTKINVIEEGLSLHRSNRESLPENLAALEWLRCVGGLEIAALVGAYIRSAQLGIPILVDGFITTVAAAVAKQINPDIAEWYLFAHRSQERAHENLLTLMQAKPLLSLDMRLGEGSGAAIAVPVIQSALTLHTKMATFNEAGVSQ